MAKRLRFKYTKELIDAAATFLSDGTVKLLDTLEDAARPLVETKFTEASEAPEMPDELKALLKANVGKGSAIQFAALLPYVIGAALGLGLSAVMPLAKWGSFPIERGLKTYRFDPASAITWWRRFGEAAIEPDVIFDDLRDQGWSDARIDELKLLTEVLPTPAELTAWMAHEVFEPDAIAKYGLDAEFEKLDLTLFEKIGIKKEQALNRWRDHWRHTSLLEMVELWRRKEVTTKDFYDWFRLVEIPPYWRDKLIKLARAVPTRVDVRRFWDMGTINEDRLRQIYQAMGYWEEDLEDYVLWTKIYVDFPDLIARYRNGWITLEEVKTKLIEDGMTEPRLTELVETKIKKVYSVERVTKERDITKAEVYAGVKKGVITWELGKELLQGMGYDEWEAQYILEIRVGATESPETPLEFRKMVESYKKAVGMEAKELPDALIQAEKALLQVTQELEGAIREGEPEDIVDSLKLKKSDAEYRYNELKATSEL